MTFDSLGLAPAILKAVQATGYTTPTPVQAESIPLALTGVDMMVSAATGSGKTAAFMLPALQRIAEPSAQSGIGPRILVLCPTRELAQQVTKAAQTYGRGFKRLSAVSVVGGMPYPAQIKLLRQPVDILVATPGRLLDYIGRGRIDFSRCEMLVLDEADRMLDMGFKEDIEQIVAALPAARQTVMFSATFGGAVGRLAESMLNEPHRIELATQHDRHADIEQRVHWADDQGHKNKLLDHLLRGEDVNQVIVFAATKRDADWLCDSLNEKGFAAASLHGDMPQAKRNRTLLNLRRGNVRVLVATDVAARGIDVPTISHVINYGMPMKAEDYVHRIGRTGRAGRAGVAITLAVPAERGKVRAIERFTAQTIPVHVVEGLEPRFKPEQRDRRPGGGERRPYGDRPRFGGDRPRFGGGERNYGDRPRFGGERSEGGDRPRFGGERNEGERARFGGERSEGGERARFGGERPHYGNDRAGNTDRPRHQDDRPRHGDDRPRYNEERRFGDKPRFGSDKPRFGDDRRFGDKPRFDDKPRFGASQDGERRAPREFERDGRSSAPRSFARDGAPRTGNGGGNGGTRSFGRPRQD